MYGGWKRAESAEAYVTMSDAPVRTLLIVDDENAFRTALVRFLRNAGYNVLEAESGEHALEVVTSTPWTIDLLLTDIQLQAMRGPELAERLRIHRPLRVLYMSGSNDRQHLGPDDALLEKPFELEELLEHVERLLVCA